MELHTIGVDDLGKTVFHLVGLNLRGEVVVRKKFSRTQLLRFTANVHVKLIGSGIVRSNDVRIPPSVVWMRLSGPTCIQASLLRQSAREARCRMNHFCERPPRNAETLSVSLVDKNYPAESCRAALSRISKGLI
jgi:hypothetical protein